MYAFKRVLREDQDEMLRRRNILFGSAQFVKTKMILKERSSSLSEYPYLLPFDMYNKPSQDIVSNRSEEIISI